MDFHDPLVTYCQFVYTTRNVLFIGGHKLTFIRHQVDRMLLPIDSNLSRDLNFPLMWQSEQGRFR